MNRNKQTSQPQGQEETERALLQRITQRDQDALSDLYARYHDRLFKFVFRLTRSYPAAEEIVNDIMLAVWRGAKNFRGDSKPSTWILGIAYRQSLKRLSRKQLAIAPQVEVETIADSATRSMEREEWVKRGLDALPATQRLAVELVFYLGLSYEEVADVTDCPVNTVKTRMFHARRKLKELLTSADGAVNHGEPQ